MNSVILELFQLSESLLIMLVSVWKLAREEETQQDSNNLGHSDSNMKNWTLLLV